MFSIDTVIEAPTIPLMADLNKTTPNIKSLFRADPNFILCDADLAQADAQIVAWEADDDILKDIFRDPLLDLHTENAKMIFGSCPSKSHPNRKKAKAGCHAVNYHVKARTLAKTLGITVMEAETFIKRWFEIHPNIKEWHVRTENEMRTRGYIENAFGNRKYFLGNVEHPTALSEALAWVPQSSVGLIINRAWDKLAKIKSLEVLLQVHDSLVFQIPRDVFASSLQLINNAMHITVPYEDPLVIPSTMEVSNKSWGDIRGISWEGYWLDKDDQPTQNYCEYLVS